MSSTSCSSAPSRSPGDVASDARLYVVMLYPLLLQVAHPTVGAGVRDYSDFEQPSVGPAAARRRLRQPARLRGPRSGRRRPPAAGGCTGGCTACARTASRYHALEPEAYAWVHATLLETYVAGHASSSARPLRAARGRALLPRVPRPRPPDRRSRARPAARLERVPRVLRSHAQRRARPHRGRRPGAARDKGSACAADAAARAAVAGDPDPRRPCRLDRRRSG